MKKLDKNKNDHASNESDMPKWKQKFEKEMDADPRLRECYERLMREAAVPDASDNEVREYYEQLLDAKAKGEGIHADWHHIAKWLEEHPKRDLDA